MSSTGMSIGKSELGRLLRTARESRGRSIRQIAERSGVGRSTLSRWECGASQPSGTDLARVLDALGMSLEERVPFRGYLGPRRGADPQALARRKLIRAVRLRNQLSVTRAAEYAGVAKATFSRWETGDRTADRQRLALAAKAIGATSAEVVAIASPGPLTETPTSSIAALEQQVRILRHSIPSGSSETTDLEFLGLDAAISAKDCADSKRVRLELRAAYVEWLGWWFRDAEAGACAARLLPALRRDPTSLVWGRLLRACANYAAEFKHDPEAGVELLRSAAASLKGTPTEGFVRRELAGLLRAVGSHEACWEELRRARDSQSDEEGEELHLYCCATIEAELWSQQGRHERAIHALPQLGVGDHYLQSASAIGHSTIYRRAGEHEVAQQIILNAIQVAQARGLSHFAVGLRQHLVAL